MYFGIHGGIDLQAAGIQEPCRHFLAVAELRLQVTDHRIDHQVDVVGLHDFGSILFLLVVTQEDQLFVLSRFILGIRNDPQLVHFPEDVLLAGDVVLRIDKGIVIGRKIGDAGDRSTFGKRKIADVLAEIDLCSGLYAITALGQADGVQIKLQDLFLRPEMMI